MQFYEIEERTSKATKVTFNNQNNLSKEYLKQYFFKQNFTCIAKNHRNSQKHCKKIIFHPHFSSRLRFINATGGDTEICTGGIVLLLQHYFCIYPFALKILGRCRALYK